MVTAVGDPAGDGGRLILAPHAAMSRERAMRTFLAIAGGVLAAAVACWLLGAWQVMPIALLVIAGVGAAIRSGYLRTQIREVVAIAGNVVAVEKYRRHRRECHEFQRGWAQVVLVLPPAPMEELSRLFIRSHGRQIEVGAFLDDDERQQLAGRLQRLMGPARSFEACIEG